MRLECVHLGLHKGLIESTRHPNFQPPPLAFEGLLAIFEIGWNTAYLIC
jgi:hypothetical protein